MQPEKTQAVSASADLEHSAKPVEKTESGSGDSTPTTASDEKKSTATAGSELTGEELQLVEELEARDREVRQHEQAHANVGGQYTGAPELEYTRGPDGRMYAASGEVSVDTSAIPDDPEATIEKMRTVIAAALAPAEPSTQDRQVAAKAQALMAEALAELANQEPDETGDEGETGGSEAVSEPGMTPASASPQEGGDESENTAPSGGFESLSETERDGVKTLDETRLEMERRLVETGVFTKVFPAGSIIEQQV
ncbi:putative metalloprotease CJM1_0395 family protein [Pontibacterium granulatum]|uniref:putative metalloprotease CJM1_0395 family protein n=1 Tax=Pontibacterium granulatum TaxID=2036029 RepID=UPI002499C481|nr:putative metalloprotease CJM1_0395 family protein [Pontibacterium granulatum]MDI3322784.1 putative metalloprotease CJM1_0395 family protein [Pontibacterium granulatum]